MNGTHTHTYTHVRVPQTRDLQTFSLQENSLEKYKSKFHKRQTQRPWFYFSKFFKSTTKRILRKNIHIYILKYLENTIRKGIMSLILLCRVYVKGEFMSSEEFVLNYFAK